MQGASESLAGRCRTLQCTRKGPFFAVLGSRPEVANISCFLEYKGSIFNSMKVKTSITLSEDLLEALEAVVDDYKNRSDLIEQALRLFLQKKAQQLREEKDLKILNQKANELNREAEDTLSYQVDL